MIRKKLCFLYFCSFLLSYRVNVSSLLSRFLCFIGFFAGVSVPLSITNSHFWASGQSRNNNNRKKSITQGYWGCLLVGVVGGEQHNLQIQWNFNWLSFLLQYFWFPCVQRRCVCVCVCLCISPSLCVYMWKSIAKMDG